MCGINGFAYADPRRPADQDLLRRMTEMVRYRGPDGEGYYRGSGAGLAMCRLSIIDPEKGQQPLYNEDRTLALVCNGEIYNYRELRRQLLARGHRFRSGSDAEVIVHLYEEHGVDCLRHLRGMFGLAIWDEHQKTLFVARDRLGIKPLYYASGPDQTLYFGSELKSIVISQEIAREIDPQALQDLLRFGFVLAPRTLFKKIKRLYPGYYLLYRAGVTELHKYWDLRFSRPQDPAPFRREEEWVEGLQAKMAETIQLHLRSDVLLGGWLSAGLDSSAIVSLMTRYSTSPVETYSLAFDDPQCDEVSRLRTLDRMEGYEVKNQRLTITRDCFELYPETVYHEECPDVSGVHAIQKFLARETAQRLKVVLTGEGADEVFGGYPWYRFDRLSQPFSRLSRSMKSLLLLGPLLPAWKPWASQVFLAERPIDLQSYAQLISLQYPGLEKRLLRPEFQAHEESVAGEDGFLCPQELAGSEPMARIQYFEIKTRLGDWILNGLDKMSMAHSLEPRVPFLDHELVEFACRMPANLKMKFLREKYILRKAMAPHLPKIICNRRKFGLRAPTSRWLRGELPEFAREPFSKKGLRKTGYFEPATAEELLQHHRTGRANYAKPLMVVLGVQLWHQQFIEGCRPPAGRGEAGNGPE